MVCLRPAAIPAGIPPQSRYPSARRSHEIAAACYSRFMENTFGTEMQAPRQIVFDFLDDESNLKKIVPNLVDAGVTHETPEKVGSTFWHVYEENGRKMKMTGVVTEHNAPHGFAVKLDGAFFGLEVSYHLDELTPTSTRVTQYSKARFKHVFKLMGLFFGKKMQREGERVQAENFARMKEMIEAEARAAEASSGD